MSDHRLKFNLNGELLEMYRKRASLGFQDFARILGLKMSEYFHVILGRKPMPPEVWANLMRWLKAGHASKG